MNIYGLVRNGLKLGIQKALVDCIIVLWLFYDALWKFNISGVDKQKPKKQLIVCGAEENNY